MSVPGLRNIRSPLVAPSPRRLRVWVLATALAVSGLVIGSTPTYAWASGSFSPSDEALLITLTNMDRASAGLPDLIDDSYLRKTAERRSQDMGDRDYFSHAIPPSNLKVFDDMNKDGYCYKVAGENIGLSTYVDDAATTRIERAFMGSASHRANILGSWTRIGVGAYKAADGTKLYTVLFSLPCSSQASTSMTRTRATGAANRQPIVRPLQNE
jgi:uncharacterized protein YkwD